MTIEKVIFHRKFNANENCSFIYNIKDCEVVELILLSRADYLSNALQTGEVIFLQNRNRTDVCNKGKIWKSVKRVQGQ